MYVAGNGKRALSGDITAGAQAPASGIEFPSRSLGTSQNHIPYTVNRSPFCYSHLQGVKVNEFKP